MPTIFGSDKYKYGDLYGLSYLNDFKYLKEKRPTVINKDFHRGNVNLYMICDSYLWSFIKSDSIFSNINSLKYIRWLYGEELEELMDSTKSNILIIEVCERYTREQLADTGNIKSIMRVYNDPTKMIWKYDKGTAWNAIWGTLFNQSINQSLEFNIFGYTLFTPLKEMKSSFNYKVFNRVDNDIVISTHKKNIFYKVTVDSTKKTSSFSYLSDAELNNLLNCMKDTYEHFRFLGFDEVYFSLIPNPVTIADPDYADYNMLIPKLQQNPGIPFIDIYSRFKKTEKEVYYRSDTHWNYEGFNIWLNEVNQILLKYHK